MSIVLKNFPLKEARALVKDLMKPKPFIYWADFLTSVSIGWATFYGAVVLPAMSGLWGACFAVSVFALYRAVIFIHEIVHFKKGTMRLFKLVWNLACGFLTLVPAFTYQGVHIDHHKRDMYGTKEDGEYLPFGAQNPWKNIGYVISSVLLPFFIIVRFILLTPLGWIIPSLGRLAWSRSSSLTIDLSYRRPSPTLLDGKFWRLQEAMTFVYGVSAGMLIYYDLMPLKVIYVWYGVMVSILLLNSLRTLGAHAYRNPGHEVMSVPEQFLDSVDIPGGLFTGLWAPVGLRFHATHHLFPNMPYHSLGTAYKKLVYGLEDNSLYLKSTRRGLFHALSTLWSDAKKHQRQK